MSERRHVERLLWRAGFGPRPGELSAWERRGAARLVESLVRPRGPALDGRWPAARVDGTPLDPVNAYDHDVLWWLDRAVRTRHPLAERMTFNLHDHFAVSNAAVGDTRLMLRYYWTLRRRSLGSFRALARAMTLEPAMQLFLDLAWSTKETPNENYARELFELFTLGANNGYTEGDIREASRALTGFWWDHERRRGGFEPDYHDDGIKTIFGRRGRFRPLDVVDLAIDHEAHAPYLCAKLWSYLSPRPCPADLLAAMVTEYRRMDTRLAPVLRLALTHEAFSADTGEPDQVKPPFVYVAGLLRATHQGVRRLDWSWLLWSMGQAPFYPPNVSGWTSGPSWLSTATIQARYRAGGLAAAGLELGKLDLGAALAVANRPWLSEHARSALETFASAAPYEPSQKQLALAQALLAGPDAQVC